jgi:glycosyltransferase involved in cell wall biosynthesis
MNRFAAVHQFHSGTAQGDAITQQMLGLQAELHGMGIRSEIFAEHVADGLQDKIQPIQGYGGSESNLMLMHHSLGYEMFDEVIGLPDDIVALYHNVTPERYFSDREFRSRIRLGREQLALLAKRALVGVANSNFTRREMLAVGFGRVEVLPVRVDYSQFSGSPVDHALRSTDWLYVGRLVGNKRQHDLVRAFAIYVGTFDDDGARLVLIGDTSVQDNYVTFVREEAHRLGVGDRVVLLGKVSDSQLRSAFLGAGVYVSASEHEGFGVPILEAMAAGLPVVAYAAAAIPETMGGAGVLLRSKDPEFIAATAQALREDAKFRERLVARQFARVREVKNFDVRSLLKRVIERASGREAPPLEVQIQGPFETSYSLAVLNRKLGVALNAGADRSMSLYATEGPGDYEPDANDLAQHPVETALFQRSQRVPYPDVVIRQMYPPRVIDSPGGITCEYFGWEESRVPAAMVDDFNRYLCGVGAMSTFVRDVLRDAGVDVTIRVVGNGVDQHDPTATTDAPELDRLRSFRFLYISSAFPRKGIDVLLDAYASVFDGSDDVSLILKTFPNPHNTVGELLTAMREQHPNPPDVRWIDRELSDGEVQGLYNLANCYVHPSRGEGFGLPVAEAMAAGVPVIGVAYSGTADFVSEETAIVIPYGLEPARTHFGIAGSVWAEPDRDRLAEQLKAVALNPDRPDLRQRVRKARDLIATEYSWEAVARRWDSFITELEDAAETPRVAMVTTWNARCGIAENTRNIVDNANDAIFFEILANEESDVIDPARETGIVRNWRDRWHPDLGELREALRLTDADVVHFQFNFGFFELCHLADLIDGLLPERGVVITFHRTKDVDIDGELVSLQSIRPVLDRVDRLIVHQEADAAVLADLGLSHNVRIAPLGASPPPEITYAEAREALGLGARPVIGTFGFLLPHKGTIELIQAIDALRPEFPDVCLIALCARYPVLDSDEYEARVRDEIAARHLAENVLLITDYLPDDVSRAILRGVDAIVLPYGHTEESSSAALRFILPLERPIVVTDEPIFSDCRPWLLPVDPTDPRGLEDAIRRVLTDPELKADLADRAATGARRFRWSRVVADHREIYTAARRAGRSRRNRESPPTSIAGEAGGADGRPSGAALALGSTTLEGDRVTAGGAGSAVGHRATGESRDKVETRPVQPLGNDGTTVSDTS